MGSRHHFVPRFYLSAFQSAPKQIGLLNLSRGQVVLGASLRDQCYVHRLYGSDEIESALAGIEGVAAALFRDVRDRHAIPGAGTAERHALLLFIALQLSRTTAAQENVLKSSQLLADVAFDDAPPSDFALSARAAMRLALGASPMIAATIQDMAATLILASEGTAFVISDHPVFKYNMFCEGITDFGVIGTKCRGLQVFVPISPQVLLYLFDAGVYKLVRPDSDPAIANWDDVKSLNSLQLVGAHENVYFHDPQLGSWLAKTAQSVQSMRDQRNPRVTRAVDAQDDRSELLHEYWPMPQLDLRLSFVSMRSNARQIPLFERARQRRTPYQRNNPQPDAVHGNVRRFEVRSRH